MLLDVPFELWVMLLDWAFERLDDVHVLLVFTCTPLDVSIVMINGGASQLRVRY